MWQLGKICLALVINLLTVVTVSGHSYDLQKGEVTSLEKMLADLKQVQTIFIGESHDQRAHHAAQLQLIKALHAQGVKISIGLEMFRQDGQSQLDSWIAGEIDEADFARIYQQHWNLWEQYRDIFLFARQEKIPLRGLNISREIVSQVARNGFASLTEQQRQKLPLAACNVTPEYRRFIRRALGKHEGNGTHFEHFCEAQMLWDASMAVSIEKYLAEAPEQTLIILAGNGHSWKHGIPEQLARRGSYSRRILLPEVPGHIDLQTIGSDDADYLLQGVEFAPLH